MGADGTTGTGTRRRVAAGEADAGDRLDRVIARALPELSRSRVKALIEAGHVALEPDRSPADRAADHAIDRGAATITEPSLRVKPGQAFAVFVPAAEEPVPRGEQIPLSVLYEDAELIVVDKPAGLVVHPAPGNPAGTLVNALIAHCGDTLAGVGGVKRPGIVHRLDKDTSGLMVAAKTDRAHAALSAAFKDRTIVRRYLALVWGAPSPPAGAIEGNIGRDPRDRKRMAVVGGERGKIALTHYRILRRLGAASLVECRLATGRTHQIRVHLAARGHPVVGDPVYGGGLTPARRKAAGPAAEAVLRGFRRQALHANVIGFNHPVTGRPLEFTTPPPDDMKRLIDALAANPHPFEV